MKSMIISISGILLSTALFSQDYLACARISDEWGYINREGKWIINPQFEHVKDFSEGLAAVRTNGEWGFVDKNGTYIVNPQFEDAYSFIEGLASVRGGEDCGYIDNTGK